MKITVIIWSHLVYTFIIGDYNSSVRIIDLVSHTTYLVCVNFIHKWRDLQFKFDSEWQIFWETFHVNFILLSEFLPEICWDEITEEILFVFGFNVWPWARTLVPGNQENWGWNQGSSPRPDIKTKFEKYFFGDFLSSDLWQKLWE